MYVIGVSDNSLIKIIKLDTLFDWKDLLTVIKAIEYDVSLANQATIFPDIKRAKRTLEDIKNNVENIQFENNSLFGKIFDEDNGFNKLSYVKELKLFELLPILVEDESD